MKLEDLQPNAVVRGVLPESTVTTTSVQWFGSEAVELTYKDPTGRVGNVLLYRHDEPNLSLAQEGRPWSFDGEGEPFRLVTRVLQGTEEPTEVKVTLGSLSDVWRIRVPE